MIYSLRKKLVWICGLTVIGVFALIFVIIWGAGTSRLNEAMDLLTDQISDHDGVFPDFDEENPLPPGADRFFDFFSAETRFSTRFFTVRFNRAGEVISEDIEFISSITEETAREYAGKALERDRPRGWMDGYRYKVYETSQGQAVVFVDGSMNRSMSRIQLFTAGTVMLGSLIIILVLILIFSKRAVKPIAESYEKQKQFITDANHELKTPLTLILTNLDIAEAEVGKNEWLEDIRAEGERMSALGKQLVALSRMDEDQVEMEPAAFSLSDTVRDTVSEFESLARRKGTPLTACVQDGVTYCGDEAGVRRVISILLDNAVKYCDSGGTIRLSLTMKRHPVICVDNSCADVDNLELNRLFDRFYRADKSRTFTGSFGIGLSIAKAIVGKHKGEIFAYKKGAGRIGFKVVLR